MKRLLSLPISSVFIFIFAVFVTINIFHAFTINKTVYGDGIFYFSWLRSIVIDQDVNMANDYQCFGVTTTNQPMGTNNRIGNKFSIGPAMLWAPPYVAIHSIIRGNGCTFPYQLAVSVTSSLLAVTGLIFLFRTLARVFSKLVASITVIAIAFATNLLYYGAVDTVNSHAPSFFASSVFLTSLFGANVPSSLAAGLALGLIGTIRPQDLLLGLLLIPFLRRIRISYFIGGFVVTFLPQLFAWQALYGKFWVSPYLSGSEGFNFLHPNILGVLFSASSGLLLWTPIVGLGFIGLILFMKSHRRVNILALTVALGQLYVVASWGAWWQGASYSGRMFVGTLPLIGFGLCEIFRLVKKRLFQGTLLIRISVLSLSVLNVITILSFLLSH